MKFFFLCSALWLTVVAYAQPQVELINFLYALQNSSELEAANATVRAAEASLAQARNPAAVEAGLSTRAPAATLDNFSDTRLNVGVTAYPLYGEKGDLARLRELELEQAKLNLNLAQTQLEIVALESAADVQLSERALELAQTSAGAAEAGYRTTELRVQRGIATAQELRDAGASRQEAQNLLMSAEANLELARATLSKFVGEAQLANFPVLPLPTGTPISLQSADRTVEAARIGRAGATRPFIPVARLNYTYDIGAQSRFSASVDSSTLAPSLDYSYDIDGYGEGSNLYLSISATFSPEQLDNVTRLEETLGAAEAAREAAEQDARIAEVRLRNRWAETDRNRRLADLILQNAERTLAEVRERERLGVGSPVETQAAAIALAQAGLDLRDSYSEHFIALLDLYEFFGLPPSEVLAASRLENQP